MFLNTLYLRWSGCAQWEERKGHKEKAGLVNRFIIINLLILVSCVRSWWINFPLYEAKDEVFMNSYFCSPLFVHRETPLAGSWYSGMVVFFNIFGAINVELYREIYLAQIALIPAESNYQDQSMHIPVDLSCCWSNITNSHVIFFGLWSYVYFKCYIKSK